MHQDSNDPLVKCQTSIGVIGVLPARPRPLIVVGCRPSRFPRANVFPLVRCFFFVARDAKSDCTKLGNYGKKDRYNVRDCPAMQVGAARPLVFSESSWYSFKRKRGLRVPLPSRGKTNPSVVRSAFERAGAGCSCGLMKLKQRIVKRC